MDNNEHSTNLAEVGTDYISRQAAIDAITNYAKYLWDKFHETCNLAGMIETIEGVPSAQRWIPVSERLPRANGRYFVTRGLNACGALWNRVYIINYSDLMGLKSDRIWWDGNVGKSDFEEITDVVAWMPLPEPWKGEEE